MGWTDSYLLTIAHLFGNEICGVHIRSVAMDTDAVFA